MTGAERSEALFRAGGQGHPRRGELARAGVRGGRGHAPVLRRRAGAVPVGRGREPVRGPGLLLGAADRRARPPPGGRGGAGGHRPRDLLRGAHRGRGGAGRGGGPAGPGGGEAAHGQLRHRGHHERGPPGQGGHRPGQAGQVRRLLPRPRRRPAGRRRLGRGHPRAARLARGDGRPDGRHDRAPLQRRPGPGGRVRRRRRPDRRRHGRAHRGQHGGRPADPGVPGRPAGRDPPRRGAAGAGRGHDRVPGPPGRRHRAVGRWSRTCSPSARCWAAASRRPPTAGRPSLLGLVAPEGPVYQAGTLSGNPLATAAGLATLSLLDDDAYRHLDGLAGDLCDGLGGRLRAGRRPGPGAARRQPVQRVHDRRRGRRLRAPRGARTRPPTPASSTPCWTAASTCPRARSRPGSSRLAHTDAEVDRSWPRPGRRPRLAAAQPSNR